MNKIKERIREQAQKLVDSDSDGSSDEEDEGEGKPGSAGSKRSSKRSSGLFGSMRDLSKKVSPIKGVILYLTSFPRSRHLF